MEGAPIPQIGDVVVNHPFGGHPEQQDLDRGQDQSDAGLPWMERAQSENARDEERHQDDIGHEEEGKPPPDRVPKLHRIPARIPPKNGGLAENRRPEQDECGNGIDRQQDDRALHRILGQRTPPLQGAPQSFPDFRHRNSVVGWIPDRAATSDRERPFSRINCRA